MCSLFSISLLPTSLFFAWSGLLAYPVNLLPDARDVCSLEIYISSIPCLTALFNSLELQEVSIVLTLTHRMLSKLPSTNLLPLSLMLSVFPAQCCCSCQDCSPHLHAGWCAFSKPMHRPCPQAYTNWQKEDASHTFGCLLEMTKATERGRGRLGLSSQQISGLHMENA